MTVLFTFPGQGAQKPGMLHALPEHAETARTLAEATAALGRDVLALDNAEALRSTVAVQLSLLVSRSHACWRPMALPLAWSRACRSARGRPPSSPACSISRMPCASSNCARG